MQALDTPLPPVPVNADSLPYWNGAREGRLLIRECKACGTRHFMARHLCPNCWSDQLEWIESKGLGTVCSFSIVHRAPTPAFAQHVPYVLALVDLDEGPPMMANILGAAARSIAIGDRVQVEFEHRGNGDVIPQFVPMEARA